MVTENTLKDLNYINGLLGGAPSTASVAEINALMASNPELAQYVNIPATFVPPEAVPGAASGTAAPATAPATPTRAGSGSGSSDSGTTDSDSQDMDPRKDPALIAKMKAATGKASVEELKTARTDADTTPGEDVAKPTVGGTQSVGTSAAPKVETSDMAQAPEQPQAPLVVMAPVQQENPLALFEAARTKNAAQTAFEVAMVTDTATGAAIGREMLSDTTFATITSVVSVDRASGKATGDVNPRGLDNSAATTPNEPLTLASLVDPSKFPNFSMTDFGQGAGRTGRLNSPVTENNVGTGSPVLSA